MHARIAGSTVPAFRRVLSNFPKSNPWVCASCQTRSIRNRYNSSQAAPKKPYYITTPIFYVNAAPHVGHLYTMILADVTKRWHELKGEKALLVTGTDEHGLKVQRAAAKAGVDPKTFCDKGAEIFKELARKAEITHDRFMRTTDQDHKDAVEYAWFLLQEKGLIYQNKHEGWYSVTDEAFYPQSGVKPYLDPSTGRKMMVSIETGSEVDWSSETNYHFRLSAFRDKLLEFYKANPTWITPEHRMQEVIQAVENGLEDLSISRPYERLSWGIRVPGDDTQTIYVWLDALVNYLTKAGYPWTPGREMEGGWPADCQVIGKDIVRFHCIYWPAFLMALGLPLPKQIIAHAHWTLGGSKMSKSTGRVVDPFHAIDRFGSDVMRLYMCRDGGLHNDTSYDNAFIISLYKNFLTGSLGNLASRVMRNKKWSIPGAVKRVGGRPAEDWAEGPGNRFWNNSLVKYADSIDEAFEVGDPRTAAHRVCDFVHRTNAYFQMSKPWDKILPFGPGEPGEEVDKIVYAAAESLRMTGIILQPWMPNKACLLLDQLGVHADRRTLEWCKPGADLDYGEPMVPLGLGLEGVLFPPLPSNE